MLTDKARARIVTHPKRQYELAHLADVDPVTFSKIKNGILLVSADDPRLQAIARVIGMRPEECVWASALGGTIPTAPALQPDR